MDEKNTNYLLKKYPKLYAQYYWDKTQTCMCWGFDIQSGWFKLIDGLSRRITKLDPDGTLQAEQVKEKFGGLRFYYGGKVRTKEAADKIRELVNKAEAKSFHICQECGKKGKMRNDAGWYVTLCERHLKERLDPEYLMRKRVKLKPFRHETNKKYKVKK